MKYSFNSIILLLFFITKIQGQLTAEIPGRPDNLTQSQVDQLLADGHMNFDGLRFDNKRMEFINFDKGSFRGTTFNGTILNDGVARRKSPDLERFDFESTNFYICKLKRVEFSNWKFIKTTFQGDSIVDGKFTNCVFSNTRFYNSILKKLRFEANSQTVFENNEFYTTVLEGNYFNNIEFKGGAFGTNVVFNSCNFYNVNFINVKFLKVDRASPVNFNAGCYFDNVKFTSVDFNAVNLGDKNTPTWLQNVSFINAVWRNGSTNSSFNEKCNFRGAATVLQNVDFTNSTFNDITFGEENANYKLTVKQCRFANCNFIGKTIFYNCNLENSTFPPVADMQTAGVKFIKCTNAPYNSAQ